MIKKIHSENFVEVHPSNKIINSLWIGDTLSNLELLTLKSFLRHGHEFHLYIYGKIKTEIPEAVILKDANEILPESSVFRYKNNDPITKQGKGSVAGFSDIFRYKLLYEKGGWWIDMDVTCMQPLDFNSPFVFRKHDSLPMVGNIMKCPPESELMARCFEKASETIDENNTDWLKPIVILNKEIEALKLQKYILPLFSNWDRWELVCLFYYFKFPISKKYSAIHWVNNAWSEKGLFKNKAVSNSTYAQLLREYDLNFEKSEKQKRFSSFFYWYFRNLIIPNLSTSFKTFLKNRFS